MTDEAPAPAPETPASPAPPAPPPLHGALLLLAASSMLLAATAMAPWRLEVIGFGSDRPLVVRYEFPYESWEGRVTLAAMLILVWMAALVLADPVPSRRGSRCARMLLPSLVAVVAPAVYLWRQAFARGDELVVIGPGRFDSLGPGVVLTTLAMVGVGFAISSLYRTGRGRGPRRPAKNLDAPADGQ